MNKQSELKLNPQPVKNRERHFKIIVEQYNRKVGLSDNDLADFIDFWTGINEGGHKMHYEKQQTFDIFKRLRTRARWLRNNQDLVKRSGVWFPDYYSARFEATLPNPNEVVKYHRHLIKKGWTKDQSERGYVNWIKPDAQNKN